MNIFAAIRSYISQRRTIKAARAAILRQINTAEVRLAQVAADLAKAEEDPLRDPATGARINLEEHRQIVAELRTLQEMGWLEVARLKGGGR